MKKFFGYGKTFNSDTNADPGDGDKDDKCTEIAKEEGNDKALDPGNQGIDNKLAGQGQDLARSTSTESNSKGGMMSMDSVSQSVENHQADVPNLDEDRKGQKGSKDQFTHLDVSSTSGVPLQNPHAENNSQEGSRAEDPGNKANLDDEIRGIGGKSSEHALQDQEPSKEGHAQMETDTRNSQDSDVWLPGATAEDDLLPVTLPAQPASRVMSAKRSQAWSPRHEETAHNTENSSQNDTHTPRGDGSKHAKTDSVRAARSTHAPGEGGDSDVVVLWMQDDNDLVPDTQTESELGLGSREGDTNERDEVQRYWRHVIKKTAHEEREGALRKEQDNVLMQRRLVKMAAAVGTVIACFILLVSLAVIYTKVASVSSCPPGSFYGKREESTFIDHRECLPCPLNTFSDAGSTEVSHCYCSGGFYGTVVNASSTCSPCDRGLWTPTKMSKLRSSCLALREYWKLGKPGFTCQDTCREQNRSADEDALRIWQTNVGMIDMMRMLDFSLTANCSDIRISHRSSGPYVCSEPECGPLRGTCFYPAPPLLTDQQMATPAIVRRFCACLSIQSMNTTNTTNATHATNTSALSALVY